MAKRICGAVPGELLVTWFLKIQLSSGYEIICLEVIEKGNSLQFVLEI